VQVLEAAESDRPSAVAAVLHELAERLRPRGVVIVISDFLDGQGDLVGGLRHLHHRRHDVVVWQVLDRDELEFPFRGTTRFRGLEGEADLLTDPQSFRAAYLRELRAFLNELQRGCREQQIDYALMPTDQPLALTLSSFLVTRWLRVG
jgi:uncharacterized protein (DUF58 family)